MKRTVSLGRIHMNSSARAMLRDNGHNIEEFLSRHRSCDWGEDANEDDRRANDLALEHGCSVLSAYRLRNGEILWVRTDGLRLTTFVWLPREEDYL